MAYHSAKAKTSRHVKGISSGVVMIILAALVIGILVGGFTINTLCKNDCFTMVSVDGLVDFEVGGEGNPATYQEPGVKCIAFGKDVSNTVTVKYYFRENLQQRYHQVNLVNVDEPGYYYAVYTSSNIKYKKVQLVRTIIVSKTEEQ